MKLIYTPEAQFFVTSRIVGDRTRMPMLGYFMSTGTVLVARRPLNDQKTIASQVMSKLEHRHAAVLRLLRPFLFSNGDGLFDGCTGLPAYDDHLFISHLFLPAVDLVSDFDTLVALLRRYPDTYPDPQAVITEAYNAVHSAIRNVNNASKAINSGRVPLGVERD